MKGDPKVIEALNFLLADELTAIDQYIVHAEMLANWGYTKLQGVTEQRSRAEMKHVEQLIERILFLEGIPIVTNRNAVHIGSTVEDMLKNDHTAELGAIQGYNERIPIVTQFGDNGTKEMLDAILQQEEDHIDYIEHELDEIAQMGIQNYLMTIV